MALLSDDTDMHPLTRHDEYYIPGADLYILVEHVQFKVHKYFFQRESQYFAHKLLTPVSPGTPLKGSDGNAMELENVTSEDFAKFLWVFYNPKFSLYEADTEVWEVILKLASRWAFPEVKDLAIRELEKKELPDVKRIKLYQDNNVDRHYLIPRYAALCEREEPLTLAEGRDLGMETTLMIARGREEARASRTASGARSPLTPTIHGADLHEFIRELFQIGAESTEADASHNPGALPPPQTEKPRTEPTATPSTPHPTQKTPPATRTQKETPAKPASQAVKPPKKGKQTGGQQQTKTTPKPETPVQETTTSPQPPLAKQEGTTTATTAIKGGDEQGTSSETLPTTSSVESANGTASTTAPDSTSPLHIITDTITGTTDGTTQPVSSIFDDIWSSVGKDKSSASASIFAGVPGVFDLDPNRIT